MDPSFIKNYNKNSKGIDNGLALSTIQDENKTTTSLITHYYYSVSKFRQYRIDMGEKLILSLWKFRFYSISTFYCRKNKSVFLIFYVFVITLIKR